LQIPRRLSLFAVAAAGALFVACGDDNGGSPSPFAHVADVSERFVSFAVDTDQVVGGTFWDPAGGLEMVPVPPYDFTRPRLRNLAAALAPAYLRIGGSAADRTYYDLDGASDGPPPGFELVLTGDQWDAAADFARALGFELIFTFATGRGPRDAHGSWTADNARELLRHARRYDQPLAAIEFGNEPNLLAVRAKLPGYAADDYARDFATFRALRDAEAPALSVLAPGNVYTRTQGEDIVPGFVFGPRTSETLPLVGASVDGVNYHYYAAISTRCPLGPRVTVETALLPEYLDGVDEAADAIDDLRDRYAPGVPAWLTETGGQSCGGQAGVADRFVNTFWFLNTLGRLARRGHSVVVRQTISGSTYGLVDELTLQPRPDYWAAFLWRRFMGTRVLSISDRTLPAAARLYTHCLRDSDGAVAILALNPSPAESFELPLNALGLTGPFETYTATATSLDSPEILVNGEPVFTAEDGTPLPIVPIDTGGPTARIAPQSWAFIVAPAAHVAACRVR
jgi:hypothetical protein